MSKRNYTTYRLDLNWSKEFECFSLPVSFPFFDKGRTIRPPSCTFSSVTEVHSYPHGPFDGLWTPICTSVSRPCRVRDLGILPSSPNWFGEDGVFRQVSVIYTGHGSF